MLEIIITTSLGIVAKTDKLIERAGRDAANDPYIQLELDQLREVLLALEGGTTLLRRAFEERPEIARGLVHATLQ